jgi:hypothetical protein
VPPRTAASIVRVCTMPPPLIWRYCKMFFTESAARGLIDVIDVIDHRIMQLLQQPAPPPAAMLSTMGQVFAPQQHRPRDNAARRRLLHVQGQLMGQEGCSCICNYGGRAAATTSTTTAAHPHHQQQQQQHFAAAAPVPCLSDFQLAEFARTGRLLLPLNDVAPEVHQRLGSALMSRHHEASSLSSSSSSSGSRYDGNNIYPRVPELRSILDAPSVRGALSSIHGEDYVLHAHRALQVSDDDQAHHQEMMDGHGPMRSHRPQWTMLLYCAPCTTHPRPTGAVVVCVIRANADVICSLQTRLGAQRRWAPQLSSRVAPVRAATTTKWTQAIYGK